MTTESVDVLMLLSHAGAPDPRVSKEAETLASDGLRVHVLAWDRTAKNPLLVEEVFTIERLAFASVGGSGLRQLRGFLRFWLWVLQRARKLRPRAVHAHDLDTFVPAYILAKMLRIPLVYDSHELYREMQVGRMPRLLLYAVAALERFAMRTADAVIVVSHIAQKYFAPVRGDTVVIGNWYDPVPSDANARHDVREELGVPEDGFLVVYTGGLMRARNFAPLIEAAAADPKLYVLVAGLGDQAQEVARRANTLHRLKYIGFTNEPERYFNAADAMYYLYHDYEHYGKFSASNALGRAVAYGTPLLTSDRGENGIVMNRVDSALLLKEPSAEEVLRVVNLLRDFDCAARVRARVEELARVEYSWNRASAALLRVYRRVLTREGSQS